MAATEKGAGIASDTGKTITKGFKSSTGAQGGSGGGGGGGWQRKMTVQNVPNQEKLLYESNLGKTFTAPTLFPLSYSNDESSGRVSGGNDRPHEIQGVTTLSIHALIWCCRNVQAHTRRERHLNFYFLSCSGSEIGVVLILPFSEFLCSHNVY